MKVFALPLVALAMTASAHAAVTLITDDFNYGATGGNWTTVTGNGGSGFNATWTNVGSTLPGYAPTNLTGTATGYTNTGNATVNGGGSASNNGYNAALGSNHSLRTFNKPIIFDMAGETVWVSALFQTSATGTGNNTYLSLGSNPANMFDSGVAAIGMNGENFYAGNGNGTAVQSSGGVSAGTTYLILARLTSGGLTSNDTLDVWWAPSNASSIGDLGTANATFTDRSLDGTFGLNGLQIGIRGGSPAFVDSFRLAYGGTSSENFAAVIPEPSSLLLLMGGLVFAAVYHRRAPASRMLVRRS